MKDYRDKEMKYLLIVYVLLLLLWCTDLTKTIPNVPSDFIKIIISIAQSAAISGVLSLITFISDSLLSSNQKDKLVGLFLINKPGATIFTRIANGRITDDRLTIAEARSKYSEILRNLPKSEDARLCYENTQWYKIYCKFQEKGSVFQAQKDYLLCRDLFVETLMFILLYIISLIAFREIIFFSLRYLTLLVLILIITNFATHKKMHRFVNNVIATDISTVSNQI